MKKIFLIAMLMAFGFYASAIPSQDGRSIGTHWTFDSYAYSDNMTITGVIQLNGEALQSPDLEVGAFCGDECRGSYLPDFYSLPQPWGDVYVYLMQIYGNNGDQITFKVYDHAAGQELDAVCNTTYVFQVNANEGNLLDPFVFSFTSNVAITATANPEEGGTVMGGGDYLYGNSCTLTATAAFGYTFINWTLDGTEVSTEPTYTFTVNEAGDYVANFELNTYTVSVSANPEEGGTVSGGGVYTHGTECTLTATANEEFVFYNWTTPDGVEVSTEPTLSFTVTEDATFIANFESAYYWEVNPYLYANNISITGVIVIDGEEQMTTDWEIGAFCNGECRGRQRPVLQFDRYILFLQVFGDQGDIINFRLYDHATATVSELQCDNTVTFVVGDIIGDLLNPYIFSFSTNQTEVQSDALTPGWNWYSTYIDLTDTDGMAMLQEGLGSSAQTIKSQSDGYASYLSGYGWYGSLSTVSNTQTYQIRLNESCELNMEGFVANPSNFPITLNNGWSWIGYPTNETMSVTDAFSNHTPISGDMVKSQSNGYCSYLEGYGWYGSLQTITPGMGLMYKSNNASAMTFCYPEAPAKGNVPKNINAENNHWVPCLTAYPDNMSVMAVVELEGIELRSEQYELAAFAEGECRGSVRLLYVEPLDRYIAFLTVAGEDAAELCFGLYNTETGEECIDSNNVITYVTNDVVGSFDNLFTVRFRETTGIEEMIHRLEVYPNPVQHGETFSIGMAEAKEGSAHVEIVNALGVTVESVNCASMREATSFKAPVEPGVYTVRISVNGEVTGVHKLLVR